ncbi:MAG: tetratricopeptide repeat protein [Salibacteraceae bacterium]
MVNKAFENGEEKYKERDFEGAVLDFTLALEKDPGNPEILYQRAMCYFHLKKKTLALLDADEAIAMQPNYSFRYASRAFMRDSFGDVFGAIQDYKEAISLDPEDAISYNNLGILEDKMGRRTISQGYYDKADNLMNIGQNSEMKKMMETGNGVNYEREKSSSLPPVIKQDSFWTIIKNTLTSKKGISELFSFIKDGFKIKGNQ